MFNHMRRPGAFQTHNRALVLSVCLMDSASSPAIDYVSMVAIFERDGVEVVSVDAPASDDGVMTGPVRIRGLVPYEHSAAMQKKELIGRIQRELAEHGMAVSSVAHSEPEPTL